MTLFRRPGVSIINTPSILCFMMVSVTTFEILSNSVLSQCWLLNLVSWPTPFWIQHGPLLKVFHSSWYQSFHSSQIADHAHGLPKTQCGVLNRVCSWMHQKPAGWRWPCMISGFSIQAKRFRSLQVLIAAQVWSSNLRKHYQSEFQTNGSW